MSVVLHFDNETEDRIVGSRLETIVYTGLKEYCRVSKKPYSLLRQSTLPRIPPLTVISNGSLTAVLSTPKPVLFLTNSTVHCTSLRLLARLSLIRSISTSTVHTLLLDLMRIDSLSQYRSILRYSILSLCRLLKCSLPFVSLSTTSREISFLSLCNQLYYLHRLSLLTDICKHALTEWIHADDDAIKDKRIHKLSHAFKELCSILEQEEIRDTIEGVDSEVMYFCTLGQICSIEMVNKNIGKMNKCLSRIANINKTNLKINLFEQREWFYYFIDKSIDKSVEKGRKLLNDTLFEFTLPTADTAWVEMKYKDSIDPLYSIKESNQAIPYVNTIRYIHTASYNAINEIIYNGPSHLGAGMIINQNSTEIKRRNDDTTIHVLTSELSLVARPFKDNRLEMTLVSRAREDKLYTHTEKGYFGMIFLTGYVSISAFYFFMLGNGSNLSVLCRLVLSPYRDRFELEMFPNVSFVIVYPPRKSVCVEKKRRNGITRVVVSTRSPSTLTVVSLSSQSPVSVTPYDVPFESTMQAIHSGIIIAGSLVRSLRFGDGVKVYMRRLDSGIGVESRLCGRGEWDIIEWKGGIFLCNVKCKSIALYRATGNLALVRMKEVKLPVDYPTLGFQNTLWKLCPAVPNETNELESNRELVLKSWTLKFV